MKERQTHETTRLLVSLANGEAGVAILEARQSTMGMDLFLRGDEVSVGRIVGKISSWVLGQVIRGSHSIIYGEHVSALGLTKEDGSYGFQKFDTTAPFNPLPGLHLDNEAQTDIQVAYRIFGFMTDGVRIDSERVGQCYCGRFFFSLRAGERKSRACSKAHQAVLSARMLREHPDYLQKERNRNTKRMSAVREAEKLLHAWMNEGRTARECEKLLHSWNTKNGSVIGKRSFFNILEKGVGTPGTQSKKEGVPK